MVRNSWGEYWGEGGWFRLKRGENQLLLESNCAWAVPGSWTELHPHHHHDHPDDPEHPDGPFGTTTNFFFSYGNWHGAFWLGDEPRRQSVAF